MQIYHVRTDLESVENALYLGVDISSDLGSSHHINRITSNAQNTLVFKKETQKLLILAFVRRFIKQLFGHSLSTPLPLGVLIQKKDIYKVEMVQRRSIRWICNSYSNCDSVTAMQTDLCLRSLDQRRVYASIICFIK